MNDKPRLCHGTETAPAPTFGYAKPLPPKDPMEGMFPVPPAPVFTGKTCPQCLYPGASGMTAYCGLCAACWADLKPQQRAALKNPDDQPHTEITRMTIRYPAVKVWPRVLDIVWRGAMTGALLWEALR